MTRTEISAELEALIRKAGESVIRDALDQNAPSNSGGPKLKMHPFGYKMKDNTKRDRTIVERHASGERYVDIAKDYGLHQSRIGQIVLKARQSQSNGHASH